MTWPWVINLRNACADPGDPYLHTWVMWWDYHQTFHDPLHLFNGNVFYPLSYSLAFTEHDYGIALFFFPLYAIGLRPLTVHSIATFLGFAFSGYGAFRLTRTLTASTGAGWIAGVAFAFIPYRFHVLSQITYVWAGWIPLLLEALVLFAHRRSWKRAIWLGVAFTMNALTSLTWMSLSLVPLLFSALVLIGTHRLWRDRNFWIRGAAAAGGSLLVMFPFLLPYLRVSRMYGFIWGPEMVTRNSPTAWNWLVADNRLRLWKGLGDGLGTKGARLFPGVVAPGLALLSFLIQSVKPAAALPINEKARPIIRRIIPVLDAIAVAAGLFLIGSLTLANSEYWKFLGRVFAGPTLWRSVAVLLLSLILRMIIVYASPLRQVLETIGNHLVSIGRSRLGEAFWLGWIWTIVGFLLSLGMNSRFFKLLFDYVFIFRSMREPSRAAMIAAVGLSLLAGTGMLALTRRFHGKRTTAAVLTLVIGAFVLIDIQVAPMPLNHGAPNPDELALWLKERPLRGGLVELPTGGGTLPHLYMLRAADHGKPLINAIATFVPPHVTNIHDLSNQTPIPLTLMDAMERVPTSYLVIHNDLIDRVRLPVYHLFLARGVASNRLRFVRRLGAADVYALVKTEPDARAEQADVPDLSLRDWSASVEQNPDNLAGLYLSWSESLYRINLVASGQLPQYEHFLRQAQKLGTAIFAGDDEQWRERERQLARELARARFSHLSDSQFLDQLLANTGLNISVEEREKLQANLNGTDDARANLLITLATDPRLIEKEKARSLVLIHFFAYLRRNPNDPPDKDMKGFDYWVEEFRKHGAAHVAKAFSESIERQKILTK